MKNLLEQQPSSCLVHGDYTAFRIDLGRAYWTGCPTCAADLVAKQADQEERKRHAEARGQIARYLASKAGLPPRLSKACFMHYQTHDSPAQASVKQAVQTYAQVFPDFDRGESLLLLGNPGTGKSHLAAAVVRHVVAKHLVPARYLCAQDLFFRVRASYDTRDETEAGIIDELVAPALLVIDELGIGRGTHHESDLLAAVLSRRYDAMKSSLLVSNLPLSETRDLLGARVTDRLVETADTLIFDWPSHRSA